jgi:hypothetical protein
MIDDAEIRWEVELDLFNQGLMDLTTPDEVLNSQHLFEGDSRFDPNFTYDPDDTSWEGEVYAPTAAEIEPDRAPQGWPNG